MPDISVFPCSQLGSVQVPSGGDWIYLDGVWIRVIHTIKDADEEVTFSVNLFLSAWLSS